MILAVSTYSLSRWLQEAGKPLEAALDWLAEHNVQAVEFVDFVGMSAATHEDALTRAAQLRRYCEQLGLHVAGYCTGAELLCPLTQQRQVIDQVKRQADIAAALGAKTMRHDVTRGPDNPLNNPAVQATTFAQVLKHIVPAIREIADHAQTLGLKTSLENHGFYMQASARVEKLILAVDHPNYGLTIDFGNFLCVNEDPVLAVTRLAKYAIMAHVKDFHVKPKKLAPPAGWFATPTPIALRGAIAGHGVVDIPRQLRILKRAGYDGYLSLEFEGMEEPRFGVEHGLNYLRQIL